MKMCPNCGLISLDDAQLCDCGYDFVRHRFPQLDEQQTLLKQKRGRRKEMLGLIGLAVVLILRFTNISRYPQAVFFLVIVLVAGWVWAHMPWSKPSRAILPSDVLASA